MKHITHFLEDKNMGINTGVAIFTLIYTGAYIILLGLKFILWDATDLLTLLRATVVLVLLHAYLYFNKL